MEWLPIEQASQIGQDAASVVKKRHGRMSFFHEISIIGGKVISKTWVLWIGLNDSVTHYVSEPLPHPPLDDMEQKDV